MNALIKAPFLRLAGLPPVLNFCLRRQKHRLLVLMFHGFTEAVENNRYNRDGKHLNAAKFDIFLGDLKKRHDILHLEEALDALKRHSQPRHAAVLTFDDGFRSNYTLAYPILQKHKAPATIFLSTEFVDEKILMWTDRLELALDSWQELRQAKAHLKKHPQEKLESELAAMEARLERKFPTRCDQDCPDEFRSLDWSQVREMLSSKLVSFGSHTHTHKILGRCQPATIREELTRSRNLIEKNTGVRCHLFCYPNGAHGDFSDDSEKALRELGFSCGLTTVEGWNPPGSSPYRLYRNGVLNEWSLPYFRLSTCGVIGFDRSRMLTTTNQIPSV